MIRRPLFAALFLIAIAPAAFAGNGWLKTVSAAQKVAREKNQLILVDMFAQWCGWCHRFEREVFPSAAFQQASSDLVLLRLDTEDGKEGTQYARKYSVSSLPTFLLLTPEMTVAGMIRGYAPPNEFARMLKETRAKHDEFVKRMKSESTYAKDYPKRLQLARELGERFDYTNAETRLKKLVSEKGVPVEIRDEAYYLLAVCYAMQKREDEGLKTIRKLTAMSRTGTHVERARFLAGQIYLQQGNLLGAANELRGLKSSFPNSPLVRDVDMMLPDIERRLSKGK